MQNKKFVAYGAAVGCIVVFAISLAGFAYAQDAATPATNTEEQPSLRGITFPVPELGNCANRASCKIFCSVAANISSCTDFAQAHGLVTKEAAERAKKFGATVRAGDGPSGCMSTDACRAYCSEFKNFGTCVAFAAQNGLKIAANDPAHKLDVYLASGGLTPGGCASKDACEAYCKDLTHADECAAFRENIGLSSPDNERIRKLGELAKSGETPGGCSSKNTCEAYCKDGKHFAECAAFAEKAGLVSQGEARQFATSTPPVGPGGCTSREACEAYCKDDTHRDECYAFAESHGVLNKEEVQDMRDGLVRLRAGLDGVPTEVRACIASALGNTAVSSIQSRGLVPGSEAAQDIKKCFERFGVSTAPRAVLKEIASSTPACLERFGAILPSLSANKIAMTPEMADVLRECQRRALMPQAQTGMMPVAPMRVVSGTTSGGAGSPTMTPKELLPLTPGQPLQPPGGAEPPVSGGLGPEVAMCLRQQLGEEGVQKLLVGEVTPMAAKAIEFCRVNRMVPQNMQPLREPVPVLPPIQSGVMPPTGVPSSVEVVETLPPAIILTIPIRPFINFILGL